MRRQLGAAVLAIALVGGGSALMSRATASAATAPPAGEVTTVRLGPFVLPPAPLGAAHQNRVLPSVPKPCADCWITGVEPRVVYPDGSRADMDSGVMLHHLVIAEPGQADVTCARTDGVGALGRRIFASGNERTPIALPAGFGFKVDPGRWVGVIELMNHSTTPRTVYFEAVVHHVPAATPGMKSVTPVWLDVNNCANSQYDVPAGPSATPWDWRSTIRGRVVAAAGHVHSGGQGVVLDNATTGQRICASRATYGAAEMAGMVTSMSVCSWDSLGVVRPGDDLRITSLYNAPRPLSGVMGIMLIAVYETSDLIGGTRAPASMRRTPTTKVPGDVVDDTGHPSAEMGDHPHPHHTVLF